MKKLLLVALLFVAVTANSQVIDTTVTSIAACKIVPFKANYTDTVNATYLGARVVMDDLRSICQLYYSLLDSKKNILQEGNVTIGGVAYQNWNGNNQYPFTFLASYFKLTFITP